MISGEIDVMAAMRRVESLRDWLRRQRRLIGYWALKDWRNADQEAEKAAILECYGELLEEELAQQSERYQRQHAYAKALGKARTTAERRNAARLLDVQT